MKRALLSGMVLALCSTGAYAAAAKPVISIKIDEGTPRYVYEKKGAGCLVKNARGCTQTSLYVYPYNVRYAPDGTLAGLELQAGLEDVMIEISTEVEKGSCEFDVGVKHELTHLNIRRRVLKHHAVEIAKSILAALERMPPAVARKGEDKAVKINENKENAMSVIHKEIEAGWKRITDDFAKNDALLDDPNAVRRQDVRCRNKERR